MNLSQFISKIIRVYLWPIRVLFYKKHSDFAMNLICSSFDNDCFISFRARPFNPVASIPIIENFCIGKKFALVLQGPVLRCKDFLKNTIIFYRKIYPNAVIIVSTWKGEVSDKQFFSFFEKYNVEVVESTCPQVSGVMNINYQIKSSLAGIKKGKELGIKFIAKTRTDQRICKKYIFYNMFHLISDIKPNTNKMRARIVVTSTFCNNMFTPYYVSDFLYYGHIDDIEKFFSCDLDHRVVHKIGVMSRKELSQKMYPPEIYLMKHYLKTYLSKDCSDSVYEYWQCLKDYFICMSRADVDLFTLKYRTARMDHVNNSEYYSKDSDVLKYLMGFDFCSWFCLYKGDITYKDKYEQELEIKVE
ncbi:WavE lipopolysaccharide synthesis [Succinivibrio dextrinosolvens]|uniref:WavE lipopolysaccharide synthesis family protein n=1 Tax=Succinivibrio dextrinosolvens TaxID=83771 RepID=UPI0008E3DF93|nr:WavE lipopolysaccharide synthesis family protein [Succinivibrio dextrinosolvens]SFS83230.1 WavE lipopolysaccharide synthesis [Succinivibrio dextrinosolvens]